MLARYHGLPVILEQLRSQVELTPQGLSLADLVRVATGLGMLCQAAAPGRGCGPGGRTDGKLTRAAAGGRPLPPAARTGDGRANPCLAGEGLSVEDFETALEEDLLVERFRQHLADTRREAHFAAHKQRYERVRLRQLTVASEGLAREVLSQIRDEGRSFTDLAAEQGSTAPVRLVFRCELPPAIAPPVFAARPHDVVGPLGTPEGFELLLIEQHLPATLDAATAARISQELFDAWLAERLRESPPELPILIQL